MNEVIEKILSRRSIKKYISDPVPAELIEKIVEAGTYAASGMNKQSPIIVAVTDKAIVEKLSKANAAVMGADMDPFYGAPAVLVVLGDPQKHLQNLSSRNCFRGIVMFHNRLNPEPWKGDSCCFWNHLQRLRSAAGFLCDKPL